MGCCPSEIENVVIGGLQEQLPYHGPPVEHVLINSLVKSRCKVIFGTRTCFTSNTSLVYPQLAQQYNLGYRFLEFLPFPYTIMINGFRTTEREYQAILYKDPTDIPSNLWQLHVEQASHSTESTFSWEGWHQKMTTTYNMSELFAKINERTANGGRYLGLTETGLDTDFHGFVNVKIKGVIYVDLLFEMPKDQPEEIYVYRTLSQQIISKRDIYGMKSEFDYRTVVGNQLSEGWRLITAFMDTGAMNLTGLKRVGVTRTQAECLYVFEKPSSRLNDNTRHYEVMVIEFPYKLRVDCSTVEPASIWNATIKQMGLQGWYITTILPTPTIKTTAGGAKTVVLLFFQRKIS